ncbi:UNVERIFIED_CONTAM: hypothetical protein GTU68_045973 [Idotea baltica]|nr:hypothetical protein [Idotea baltica]
MGRDLYAENDQIKKLFDQANEILGFELTKVMFEGSAEDLKQTKITQPAVFLYALGKFKAANITLGTDVVGGHSLGEITALVAAGALDFEDGLKLVSERALAMQDACEANPGTMAAILGMEDADVESITEKIDALVVPANYNTKGQLVISGSIEGVDEAVAKCTEAGARRAIVLQVGGAFHSELMKPAQERLSNAIESITFNVPAVPIFQNVDAMAHTKPEEIKKLLNEQLTSPVRWTQTMENMISHGVETQVEAGGKVLTGFIKKIDRKFPTEMI